MTREQGETLALTTTLASLGIPPAYHQAIIYVPSTDFRLHVNPAIKSVRYYDASNSAGARFEATGTTVNGLTRDMTDRDTATGTGTAMDSGATADFVYVCFADIVGGMRVTIGSANGTASVLAGGYWNGSAWTALTITDGTESPGGTTLGATGSVTWTVPTDWKSASLRGDAVVSDDDAPPDTGFWARFSWSVALDSDTEIDELWSLNRDTTRSYYRLGTDYLFSFDRRIVGSVELVLASGTDTAEIDWVRSVY